MVAMEMKHFRHKETGLIDLFPEHFVQYDFLELVDPNEAACIDCGLEPTFLSPPDSDEDTDEIDEIEDDE